MAQKISAEYLESIVGDNAQMLEFGKKYGFVANFRSFYEADRVVPDVIYPIEAKYVDGFDGCPDIAGSLKEACDAAGIATVEYDDYLYLDTERTRWLLGEWDNCPFDGELRAFAK